MDGKIWLSDINQKMNIMKSEKGKEKENAKRMLKGKRNREKKKRKNENAIRIMSKEFHVCRTNQRATGKR